MSWAASLQQEEKGLRECLGDALYSGHSFELYFDGANANTFEFCLRECSLHFSPVFYVLFIYVCVQVCMCHGVQCGGLAGVTSLLPPCELLAWSRAISPVQQALGSA